jgi:hypothetical protein
VSPNEVDYIYEVGNARWQSVNRLLFMKEAVGENHLMLADDLENSKSV